MVGWLRRYFMPGRDFDFVFCLTKTELVAIDRSINLAASDRTHNTVPLLHSVWTLPLRFG